MNRFRCISLMVVVAYMGLNSLFCQQVFEVNLNDRSDDTFKVTLLPEHLSKSNNVFQFASTAPGTYQRMDVGKYVSDFKAYDRSGRELTTQHLSVNQWSITDPETVQKITYTVADMWNAKVDQDKVFPMCSTTLSDDFVMINGQGVFGYFSGMQSEPIRIKLDYPSTWEIGTALEKDKDGYYRADDFDNVVDSPFYLGKLSTSTTELGGAKIEVYTYSQKGLITSNAILESLKSTLAAESDFTKGLPVNRYAFLFYFGPFSAGAWEHSYSSEYVMKEDSLTPAYAANLISIVAHEFFHVNIPLNIHSELIEHFNFVKPEMSQHLWFYEGTTEWAAHILQLRDGLISLDQYLNVLQNEFNANDGYDQNLSLTDLGMHSTELQKQYPNIYQKGALVSTFLDIRLLQLSGGKRGLRELINDLARDYGKKRSFSEARFFDELVKRTYPEIGDFIDRYIMGTEKLPAKEYFSWLGIGYQERVESGDSTKGSLGISMAPSNNELEVVNVSPYSKSGLIAGDVIEKVDGMGVTLENVGKVFGEVVKRKPGSKVTITIRRTGKEMDIAAELAVSVVRHKFTIDPNASSNQIRLRKAWMENL